MVTVNVTFFKLFNLKLNLANSNIPYYQFISTSIPYVFNVAKNLFQFPLRLIDRRKEKNMIKNRALGATEHMIESTYGISVNRTRAQSIS